jgi:enoyl-CoA hydratase/carnithine racemase
MTNIADVAYERRGNTAHITINRPQAMNALGPDQHHGMIQIWEEFRDDSEALVAILSGAGDRAFCAGADLKTYTPLLAERDIYDTRQDSNRYGFGGITRGLEIWKPIIAAVNGYALAGGLELALACDIRIASDSARFGCSEVQRGFHHCDGGTVRLPLIVGLGNALKMQLTGEAINAQEALRIGLVSQVVSQNELIPTAERMADLIASNGPLGVRSAKESMLRSLGRALEDALRFENILFSTLTRTEDYREGPKAFAEKRPPVWQGR